MIKYLNDGEIKILKEGFFNSILLKKLNMLPFDDYKERKVPFHIADSIFKILIALDDREYYQYANIMFDYMSDANIVKFDNVIDRIRFMDSYMENIIRSTEKCIPENINNKFQIKKLFLLPVDDFMVKKASFDMAKLIFNTLIFIDIDEHEYKGYATIMLEYLHTNEYIDSEDYENIRNNYLDTTRADVTEDMISDKYDEVCTRMGKFDMYLDKLCSKNNIELKTAAFYDIFDDMYDDEVFDKIRDDLHEFAGKDDENIYEDDYASIFMEDAQLYVLKNFEFNYTQIAIINHIFTCYSEGIITETYVQDGNTYLTITDGYFLDNIDYLIFIALNIFITENITKN